MSVISGCGMFIIGVVKFSARNCPGINSRTVGNYAFDWKSAVEHDGGV